MVSIRRKASRAGGRSWRVCAAAALCALLVVPAAQAETLVNNGGGSVTIVSEANGSPYPSEIRVQGGDGDITDVNVRVAFSHTAPDDIDLVIVSPTGVATVLMSDACGDTDLSNTTLTFDQQAASSLNNDGPCATGTFKPTDFDAGQPTADNWPAPGPGTSAGNNLDSQNGLIPNGNTPNGFWRLFVVDDAAVDSGSIASWGLTITTETGEVIIPAGPALSGVANPYPSVKSVPSPAGEVIREVDPDIFQFNHSFPDDVDMLLQGPGGQAVMLMSDACGDADLQAREWSFDSFFGTPLSDGPGAECLNFVAQPSDFGDSPESLPAPAPQRPYEASLDVFAGLPGGDWRLWVDDDSDGDTGYISGWNLTLKTRPTADTGFTAAAVATAEGQTATVTATRTAVGTLGPATINVAIGHTGANPADLGPGVPSQLQFARGEASKTIEIPIAADREGEGAEDFVVSLTNPVGDARLSGATSSAVVTIAPSEPDNRFTIDEVKRLRNGSARLTVTIPNPGSLTAEDAGPKDLLKPTEVDAPKAGEKLITVKPAQKAKRKLKRGKKVKLTAEITYKPDGGTANSDEVPVTLKKKPK